MKFLLAIFCLLLALSHARQRRPHQSFLRNAYPSWEPEPAAKDIGAPLLLTPYIKTNRISTARSLAAVNGRPFDDLDIPSYSGYFTVNEEFNSNLFFWFFPAEHDYENAPVLLWLQGGPGASSLFGLFEEIGPFFLAKDDITLELNPYSWHKNHSLIFIDNPVGTGFELSIYVTDIRESPVCRWYNEMEYFSSFTDFDEGYATNQTQIGLDLYSALDQFLTLFPELRSLPLYLAGESYAGKYVPTLAYTIHHKNPTATHKMNLQGIAVGNGWTDPVNMMDISSFVYHLGFVDDSVRQEMKHYEDIAVRAIQEGNYEEADYNREMMMYTFARNTEFRNTYNFVKEKHSLKTGNYVSYVQRKDVRKALHVGEVEYGDRWEVMDHLQLDLMQSVRPWLEEVLDNYRVLYYSGQLDIIVAYPLSLNMYRKLQFGAAEEYRNAKRVPWFVGEDLAGFVKSGGNFTEVLVRNAGHMVPSDQPIWAFDLITKFTRDDFRYPYGRTHKKHEEERNITTSV